MNEVKDKKDAPETQRRAFLEALYKDYKKYIEVREINRNGEVTARHFFKYKELQNYEPPMDKNIYVGIYERKNNRSGAAINCSKTSALWIDFDDMTEVEATFRLNMSGLPLPHIMVGSGNGIHAYWLLDKPAGEEAQPVIKALQEKLEGDSQATDIPRILRMPGTMNVKDDPKSCSLLSLSERPTISLQALADLLGVRPMKFSQASQRRHSKLAEIKFNGLHNMAGGVTKGSREFCTGRIVQTLKRLNYTRQQVEEVVFEWNRYNKPPQPSKTLREDLNKFWYGELKYDGRAFTDERLQELNERFVGEDTIFFKSEETNAFHYDNDLLGDDFHKLNGLVFAVLAMVKMAGDDGITRSKIVELSRRDRKDKTLEDALSYLEKNGHVEKRARRGFATLYFFKEKPFVEKRGYTSVPKLLHKLFVEAVNARELEKKLSLRESHKAYSRLNELRYKLLILLESYAYDTKREVFPANRTLADRMRVHSKTIKRNLDWLEDNQFIKIHQRDGKRYIQLIYA